MEKPFRYRKKLLKIGNSYYVIVPAGERISDDIFKVMEVILEVYNDKIVIKPAPKK